MRDIILAWIDNPESISMDTLNQMEASAYKNQTGNDWGIIGYARSATEHYWRGDPIAYEIDRKAVINKMEL